MNGLRRHEAFQRVLARGARRQGALVLSTATTECCDLVVLPPLGSGLNPILLEVKTRRDTNSATLPPLQQELVEIARGGRYLLVQATAVLRIEGHRPGTREPYGKIVWTVNGEKEGLNADRYKLFLNACLEKGYTPLVGSGTPGQVGSNAHTPGSPPGAVQPGVGLGALPGRSLADRLQRDA